MDSIRLINIKESILADNKDLADQIRAKLGVNKVFMLNLMASPGAGKTSLIIETLRCLKSDYSLAVIEGDIESQVDSEKVVAEGVTAVQLRTGGACHLDAPMVKAALDTIALEKIDAVVIENIGNLVCPAEFDTGAHRKAMILSVPEGDDKVLKYPLMFSVCDVLVINKTDYLGSSDFNMETLVERVLRLNPAIRIFKTSCKTAEGLDEWCSWLKSEIEIIKS
jgi:hydrogenase nickel incorporation protein HypB